MANQVRIPVSTPGAKQSASEMDRLRDKFDRLQRQGARGIGAGIAAGATVKAFGLVDRAIGSTINYLGDAAQAYRDDEKSQAQLRTSLAANVTSWNGNARAIEKVLEERTKLGFSDDEQRESLTKLVAVTKNVNTALDAQRTAMDLARMRGLDLASASEIIAKVAGGNVGILKRYGITVAEGASATEALAAVQKIAAGQAESFARTTEGKLVVAEVKAAEASEKFGKSIARIQADVLPAAADGIDQFADVIDGLQTSLDSTAPALVKARAAVDALDGSVLNTLPGGDQLIAMLDDGVTKLEESEEAANQHGDALIGLRQAASRSQTPLDDMNELLEEQADAAKDAEREIDDLAETIADELFGDAINAGNLADLRKTHDELVKQREAAKKGSREWKILTGEIAENDQALFELQLQMKEKEGPRAVIDWLRKQQDKFGDVSGTLQTLIDRYRKLMGLQSRLAGAPLASGIAYTGANPGRASGGPVAAHSAYTVGENGPETLVMGNQSGTVIPNGGAMPSGGGVWTLNVNVSTPVLTPGSAEALARAIVPAITREQQRLGLIPRRV